MTTPTAGVTRATKPVRIRVPAPGSPLGRLAASRI